MENESVVTSKRLLPWLVAVAFFMESLDTTILNTAVPTIAAALKILTENILFETYTHKKPTLNDMYLIHQQGIDGASEHVSHPQRLAWQSMCATDEGKEKGEKWCKRAIWGNTLPDLKRAWKNVNNVSSSAFVVMWQQRLAHFYSRYSEPAENRVAGAEAH